mmetsp:Transcript_16568/g.21019  ORF Transcript_16568/g.21019 Transcript_16568/m.21019 type:complete len:203 (-) Transcript_16568:367-975(-)
MGQGVVLPVASMPTNSYFRIKEQELTEDLKLSDSSMTGTLINMPRENIIFVLSQNLLNFLSKNIKTMRQRQVLINLLFGSCHVHPCITLGGLRIGKIIKVWQTQICLDPLEHASRFFVKFFTVQKEQLPVVKVLLPPFNGVHVVKLNITGMIQSFLAFGRIRTGQEFMKFTASILFHGFSDSFITMCTSALRERISEHEQDF